MPRFLIHHSHEPRDCGVVFAAFRGHDSTLRHGTALATCDYGGHAIFWTVDATDEQQALGLLPYFVSQRATVIRVSEVRIP